jgi:hypothetical protein
VPDRATPIGRYAFVVPTSPSVVLGVFRGPNFGPTHHGPGLVSFDNRLFVHFLDTAEYQGTLALVDDNFA